MTKPAERIGVHLQEGQQFLAVAESLTGGLVCGEFARAPHSSEWFRGGVVAYSRTVKHQVLAVPLGPVVSGAAAAAMAAGVADLTRADVAVAVTGVGGPDGQDGQSPGTVWVATWPEHLGSPVELRLEGEPDDICAQACSYAVRLLAERLDA